MTIEQWQKIIPAIPGVLALIGVIWVDVRAGRRARNAEAIQKAQFEKVDERAREAQRLQKEQFERTEDRIREAQRLQEEQFQRADERAREGQRLQKEQSEKAVTVEKHTQAYQRWLLLYWFKREGQDARAWADFMNEMKEWLVANRLYLSEGAAQAFSEALHARTTMDVIGNGPGVDHHRTELFKKLDAAGDVILANSPRYGS